MEVRVEGEEQVVAKGDTEYRGIDLDPEWSSDNEERPVASKKYEKVRGILGKGGDLSEESSEEESGKVEGIKGSEDLKEIVYLLRKRVGTPFSTNVLRVALNFKEEKIASTLISYYKCSLDERMICRAIKTGQMDFLYCVWAFNKNYERLTDYKGENGESDETESDADDNSSDTSMTSADYE